MTLSTKLTVRFVLNLIFLGLALFLERHLRFFLFFFGAAVSFALFAHVISP